MRQEQVLWAEANRVAAGIADWLRDREGKSFYVRLKPLDLVRLLNLRVWQRRYHLDLNEILDLMLPYLRKSTSEKFKTRPGRGLGVSIAALTGVGAEKILAEALRQQYPGGEWSELWRAREKQRQLKAEEQEDGEGVKLRPKIVQLTGPLEADSVDNFLRSYRKRVLHLREIDQRLENDPSRQRKRYRGNPWI